MANFEVLIYPAIITPHHNADAIEIANIGGYKSIVQKDTLKTGDLVAYIPEASIVPDWLLEEMNLTGRLAGKQGNRVKAIRLRGVLSQGLCYPLTYKPVKDMDTHEYSDVWVLQINDIGGGIVCKRGDNVTEQLGITKYEPVIPTCMDGEIFNAFGCTIKYDIENWKKFPSVLQHGQEVVMTEKIHGTWCCFGHHPDVDVPIVTSKGFSDRGLTFKFSEENDNNLYVKMYKSLEQDGVSFIDRLISQLKIDNPERDLPFYLLGEIYGPGVQDLTYGTTKREFRVFDLYIGEPGLGYYASWEFLCLFCVSLDIPMVPYVYRGPYSEEKLFEYTDGKETISGNNACIREGVVIKPVEEDRDPALGRVILKSVSDKYLTRKNGTEYN